MGIVQLGATHAFDCSRVAVTSWVYGYRQTEQTCQEWQRPMKTGLAYLAPAESLPNSNVIHDDWISRQTVARRLRAHGIRACRPYIGHLIPEQIRRLWLGWDLSVWCRQPRDWPEGSLHWWKYKTSLEPTTSTSCRGLHAHQICPKYITYGISWIIVVVNIHTLQPTNNNWFRP